ncbi:hypothetical protein DY000_02059820 [Brassica cretica]|uniref:Uncharacterized protein n=1 Tax=Brassica cretica TaxID=69181 RepID=A0ABQ7B424_BRACR|nr:hypothetical protein DY000_02059820 [Brassica cretica]
MSSKCEILCEILIAVLLPPLGVCLSRGCCTNFFKDYCLVLNMRGIISVQVYVVSGIGGVLDFLGPDYRRIRTRHNPALPLYYSA